MNRIRIALAAALIALVATASPARAQGFKIIVNASVADAPTDHEELAKLFLKQNTRWPDGSAVVPVDQSPESAVRHHFSKTLLGREVGSIKAYWQQQIFGGRSAPPTEKGSDSDVASFVASTPGAIGYVSAGTALPSGAKLLASVP